MSSSPVHDSSRSERDSSDIQIPAITADTRRRARTPEVIVIDSDDDMNTAEIIQATRVHWPHMPPKRMRRMDSEENHTSRQEEDRPDVVHVVENNEVEERDMDSDIEILDVDQVSEVRVISMDLDTEILEEGATIMEVSEEDSEGMDEERDEENEDSNDDDGEDRNMIDESNINSDWMSGDEEMNESEDDGETTEQVLSRGDEEIDDDGLTEQTLSLDDETTDDDGLTEETLSLDNEATGNERVTEQASLRDGQVTEEILLRNDGDLDGDNPSSSPVVETRDEEDVPSTSRSTSSGSSTRLNITFLDNLCLMREDQPLHVHKINCGGIDHIVLKWRKSSQIEAVRIENLCPHCRRCLHLP
ncbi:unnamed protein product [Thelazia callipaeda]|uniref:Acidic repeat-containing protein-like n=1 Tax=Thelazia callipaeda TaxID=103827 RepID=A0A0N5DA57_THECL|nr:unnamed protein product [Thelazia callipaeda]